MLVGSGIVQSLTRPPLRAEGRQPSPRLHTDRTWGGRDLKVCKHPFLSQICGESGVKGQVRILGGRRDLVSRRNRPGTTFGSVADRLARQVFREYSRVGDSGAPVSITGCEPFRDRLFGRPCAKLSPTSQSNCWLKTDSHAMFRPDCLQPRRSTTMESETETLQDLVRAKIENLRPKLLDLSRRNPLIATKLGPRSNSHIRVVAELPDILFYKLNNGQEMPLVPLPAIDEDPRDEQTSVFRDALINARLTDEQYL